MSVQEIGSGRVPLPDVEIPEFSFKPPAQVLSKWERFKRRFDREWRPSLAYALVVNIILLVAILALIWVSVASGGFILNPPSMLGLFSLPILLATFDGLRLMEQEEERKAKNQHKQK